MPSSSNFLVNPFFSFNTYLVGRPSNFSFTSFSIYWRLSPEPITMIVKWFSNSIIPLHLLVGDYTDPHPSWGFMASYFIWWFIICYWHLFLFLSVDLASGYPFKLAPLSFWHIPIIPKACSYFLIQRHSRLILYFICSPEMAISLRRTGSFSWKMMEKRCAHCYCGIAAPKPSHGVHVCKYTYIFTYTYYELIPVLPIPTFF